MFMTKRGDSQTKKTIHELVKEFPDKTYQELEKYRDADRIEEADSIPLTPAQQNLVVHNEKIKELQKRITELETGDDKKQKTIERLEKEVKVLEEVNLRPNKGIPSIWERIDAGWK